MSMTFPPHDAGIGKKIDALAKALGDLLRPLGWRRRNRVFSRVGGEGPHRYLLAIDLQGDKWNMGRAGKFTVNLAVRFPEITRLTSQLPGQEWQADVVETPDTALGPSGGLHGRLGATLPKTAEDWWLPEFSSERSDLWIHIAAEADLDRIANALTRAVRDYALPWLDQRSSLAALSEHSGSEAFGPSARDGVFAAILDGHLDRAADALRSTPSYRLAANAAQFAVLRRIAERYGVATHGLAWEDRPADPRTVQRQRTVATLKSDHRAQVDAFLADATRLDDRLDAFLDAWIDDCADAQLSLDATTRRLWPTAAGASLDGRRALLLRLLQRFPEARAPIRSTVQSVYATYENFHHGAWSRLAEALLKIDEGRPEDHGRRLLAALPPLADLVDTDFMFDRFRAPLVAVLSWVWTRCDDSGRHALKPEASRLLESIREHARRRSRDRFAHPPSAATLGDDLAAQLAVLYTPEAQERMDQLLAICPERAFADADRDGVLLLRRWQRLEPDGRVPLEIEHDDWGRVLQESLAGLSPEQRRALGELLEWFDRGVEVRPSKRWLTELTGRIVRLDRRWFLPWLAATLGRFGETTLTHIAAAAGFGAFPGTTSGNLLLGLIHAVGIDGDAGALEALQEVARGAFVVVPGQRMRCQSAGTAALPLLARTPSGREFLESLQRAVRQKSVRGVIGKVLG